MSQSPGPVPESSEEDRGGAADPSASAEPQRGEDFFSPSARRPGRAEEQQFRLFQQFMRRHETTLARREHRRDESEDEGASGGRGASAGPPPEWHGPTSGTTFEDWLIKARLWLATTKAKSRARGPLLLKALHGPPFEHFKYLARDVNWVGSDTNSEELLRMMDTPEYYGEDKEEHLLASLSRITFHLKRGKAESWQEYFARWETALRKVREHNITLPEAYLGFLLINGLKLEEHDVKSMLNYTRGDIKPSSIKSWLRKNETKLTINQLGIDQVRKSTTSTSSATTSIMFTENKIPVEEHEATEDFYDQETDELEAFLSELKDDGDDGDLPEEFSEGEAAEILSTMIAQRRSYAQSMKQKKHAELSRGYGKPLDNRNKPFRPGRYQVTIEELKKRTRCNLCNEKGHWKRECPKKKDKGMTSSETHYLENDKFGSNEEAFFCGCLELTEPISERDRPVGCSVDSIDPFWASDATAPEQYMLSKTGLFMFENYFCDVVNKSPFIPDESCATLDTGCQRLAIGKNTLVKLMKHLPQGLQVHLIPSQNTFRSVHGVSSTHNLAAIPCAIGPRGCYLRPALFEDGFGIDAPFLISLPFLLKTRGQLVLDQNRGLQLRLTEPKCEISIHLGPSGALRLPLMQFDDEVLRCLQSSQQVLAKSEFEIFGLHAQSPELFDHQAQSCCGEPDSHNSVPASVGQHGWPCDQTSSRRTTIQRQPCLGQDPPEAALPDLSDDTPVGDVDSSCRPPCRRGRDGGAIGDERFKLESDSRRPLSLGVSPESRSISNIEGINDGKPPLEQCERHSRDPPPDRTSTKMSLPPGDQHMDLTHRGQSGQDLCSLSTSSRPTMSVLPVVRDPAPRRLDVMALQGRCGGQSAQSPGDLDGDDSGQVRAQEHHEGGVEWSSGQKDLQDLQASVDHQKGEGSQCLKQLSGFQRLPTVHGVEACQRQEVGPKFQRKVHSALKRTVSFWQEIQALFTACGVDGQTTSDHISRLNQEIMDDLIRFPRGTKRTRELAESMHLTHKDLKVVAEVFNPNCFDRAVRKHGLTHGLAFDLQLGDDLLDVSTQEEVKQYIRVARPGLTVISPPCEMYSQLQNLLKDLRNRRPESMERYLKKKRIADKLLTFAIDIALLCIELNLSFVLEHPWSASSWKTVHMRRLLHAEGVQLSRCDQCMTGLQSENGSLQRKRTGFATNNEHIARAMDLKCDQSHLHEHIIGGRRSKGSQVYTEDLKDRIIKAYKKSIQQDLSLRTSHEIVAENRWVESWMVQVVQSLDGHSDEEPLTNKFEEYQGLQRVDPTRGLPELPDQPPGQDLYPAEVEHSEALPSHGLDGARHRDHLQDSGGALRDHALQPLPPDPGLFEHDAQGDDQSGGQVCPVPAVLQPEPEGRSGQDRVHEPEKPWPGQRPISLARLIQRAHEGLGHPHKERFLRILRFSKASKEVMDAARQFTCSACQRNSAVKPARRAAPPREIETNEVVGIDVVWLPTEDGKSQPALNCIDWATHFQLVVPMKDKNPTSLREAYRHWLRFFGPPQTLALDLGREFEGVFALRAETDGSYIDPSSVESPYQRGITERAGKTFKVMLSKAMQTYECQNRAEWRELVDIVNYQKNRLLMRNGYSPIQRVIGYSPRLPGGMMSGDAANRSVHDKERLGDRGVVRAMQMRKAAALAFHSTECEDALRRALASGPRPFTDFEIGEAVYFWRVGQGAARQPAPAYWHGPARVVMLDQPTTVWLAYQGKLVKASPERIRRASEEEQLTLTGWIDDLVHTRDLFERTPKRGFLDITTDPLPPAEEFEIGDKETDYEPSIAATEDLQRPDPERVQWQGPLPPVSRRLRQKTMVKEDETLDEDMDQIQPLQEPYQEPGDDPSGDRDLPDLQSVDDRHAAEKRAHDEPTEEIEEEPVSKRSRLEYLEIFELKVMNLLKAKQSKEVRFQELSKFNKECFNRAMAKEIENNLNIGAYEPLSLEESARVRQKHALKIMESRYVMTAKPLEPLDVEPAQHAGLLLEGDTTEPRKAKVRHVMKGFSETGSEFLDSTTPQVTRDAAILVLQLIASFCWRLGFLDFTQAFHSGDAIQRLLFAEQPREGIPGLVPGQLIKLLKTCYGLTDGPYAWFSHIRRVLVEELGYTQSKADPCVFFLFTEEKGIRQLRGVIGLATDDMIHGGDQYHDSKMAVIKQRYKLGKFQYDEGRFCGKDIKMDKDGSILIHQSAFAKDKVEDIPISKERKKHRYSFCTEVEVGALRALLGSLAWLSKETRPDLAGRVALLQQSMPTPRIKDIVEANLLAQEARRHADSGIRIMPIQPKNLRVGIITDASWGNARQQRFLEESTDDFWEEQETCWVRHHRTPRSTLFHPAAASAGPDLHDLLPDRTTYMDTNEPYQDDWTKNDSIKNPKEVIWTGTTVFHKQKKGEFLKYENINEVFLQLLNTSSQGGMITMFYDADLETKSDPQMITIANWKSTRLKRKTVNTLSAECQSMVLGVGSVHWHRFLLLEALGHQLNSSEWEAQLAAIPYIAVTDSRSLYDCMSKLVCSYTQTEDKRTAIDIAILKDDLQKSGGHARWVAGNNMVADALTKRMKGHLEPKCCP
eukprot:s2395_g15.t1